MQSNFIEHNMFGRSTRRIDRLPITKFFKCVFLVNVVDRIRDPRNFAMLVRSDFNMFEDAIISCAGDCVAGFMDRDPPIVVGV